MTFTLADVYYLPIFDVLIGLTIIFVLLNIRCKLTEITALLKQIRDKP
jgi:cyanate permease